MDDRCFNVDVYRQLILIPNFSIINFPKVLLVLISQYIRPPALCLVSHERKCKYHFVSSTWSRHPDDTGSGGWEMLDADDSFFLEHTSSQPSAAVDIHHFPTIKYQGQLMSLISGAVYKTNLEKRITTRCDILPLYCISNYWSAAQVGRLWFIVHSKGGYGGWVYDLDNSNHSNFGLPGLAGRNASFCSKIVYLEEEGLLLLFTFYSHIGWILFLYNPSTKVWQVNSDQQGQIKPTSLPHNTMVFYAPVPTASLPSKHTGAKLILWFCAETHFSFFDRHTGAHYPLLEVPRTDGVISIHIIGTLVHKLMRNGDIFTLPLQSLFDLWEAFYHSPAQYSIIDCLDRCIWTTHSLPPSSTGNFCLYISE